MNHTDTLTKDLELFPNELDRIAKGFFANGLLSDLGFEDFEQNLTEYDVKRKIAAEVGHVMTIYVAKQTGETLSFTITPETTLQQLKDEIQTAVSNKEEPLMGSRRISWNFVWRNYCLLWNNHRLLENKKTLFESGIRNGDKLLFSRYKV